MKSTRVSIKVKLIMIFGCIMLLSAIVGSIAIIGLRNINDTYVNLIDGAQFRALVTTEIQVNNATIHRMIIEIANNSGNAQLINDREVEIQALTEETFYLIEQYKESSRNDIALSDLDIQNSERLSDEIIDLVNQVKQYVILISNFSRAGFASELEQVVEQYVAFSGLVRDQGILMRDASMSRMHEIRENTTQFSNTIQLLLIVAVFISFAASLVFTYIAIRSVKKPIAEIEVKAKQISSGDFSVNMRVEDKDEMGILSNVIADTIEPFTNLINSLEAMAKEVDNGVLSSRIDESEYYGDYKKVVVVINRTINNLVQDNVKSLDVVKAYGEGNFKVELEKFPGERAIANEIVDSLQANLMSVDKEIETLIKAVSKGDLSVKLDSSKYTGNWKDVIEGLNNLLTEFTAPLQESAEVLSEVVKGDFSVRVTGNYKGDLTVIKDSINTTVTNLQSYILEIRDVLGKVANKDLTTSIQREYLGEFIGVRASINEIVQSFSQVMSEIDSSSVQIASGVSQVSESSITLAQGAAEQSNAVEDLNLSIGKMITQVQNSSKNANETSKLALSAKQSADIGNQDMKKMLVSMSEINKASEDISKIIKVIDDIAFQTNLLALNAAVEAARAGEHGKGFAVVAEEVRALALRSKNAAAETNVLIETSIQKTSVGSKTANKTAQALDEIVRQISSISVLIEDVAKASTEQTISIEQINKGVAQIASVTQLNTATSEESASVSEELSSQTDTFRNMVDEFKLK